MQNKHILYSLVAAVLFVILSTSAFAAVTSYKVVSGDTLRNIATKNHLSLAQVMSFNPQIKNINLIFPNQIVNLALVKTTQANATTTKPTPKPVITVPAIPAIPVLSSSEKRFTAYTTGYGWPDNTPKGSAEISNPIVHSLAGGTGTYTNPITLAVGHSFATGKDVLDYPAGTKFYIPNLRKYFIAEDTCGDGNTPQNGPCHSGYEGHAWLDLWVGGNASNESQTLDCEDTITDTHLVIQNPASNYAVVSGDVASGCKNYGDTVVTL